MCRLDSGKKTQKMVICGQRSSLCAYGRDDCSLKEPVAVEARKGHVLKRLHHIGSCLKDQERIKLALSQSGSFYDLINTGKAVVAPTVS